MCSFYECDICQGLLNCSFFLGSGLGLIAGGAIAMTSLIAGATIHDARVYKFYQIQKHLE